MNRIKTEDRHLVIGPIFEKIPGFLWGDWVYYKGELKFVMVNVQKSETCNRPIIDICYCATRALNNIVEKSVNYVPDNFRPKEVEL